ncbi:MAG: hypothetical protein GC205_09620 [Bacteroidetes bacterium]|nr:hypothetical protein [Bacteroidota bacterium]
MTLMLLLCLHAPELMAQAQPHTVKTSAPAPQPHAPSPQPHAPSTQPHAPSTQPPPSVGSRIFQHYTSKEGLSQNTITALVQDDYGFLWIGTQDGLSRFDGQQVLVFRQDAGNPNSLTTNYVKGLFLDSEGLLWVGTLGAGLVCYDPTTEQFTTYRYQKDNPNSLPHDNVFSFAEGSDGAIWAGTNNGLARIDKQLGTVERYLNVPDRDGETANHYIGTLCMDQRYNLWVGTDSGLLLFDPVIKKAQHIREWLRGPSPEPGYLHKIRQFGDRTLIACDAGLLELLPDQRSMKLLTEAEMEPYAGSEKHSILDVMVTRQGAVWLATQQGAVEWHPRSGQRIWHQHNPSDAQSLAHNNVTALHQTRDGVLWFGTRNGLSWHARENPLFDLLRHIPSRENSLVHAVVNAVTEDQFGRLWVGTAQGLSVVENGVVRKFPVQQSSQKALEGKYMLSLLTDREGVLWAGVKNEGLYRLDGRSGTRLEDVRITQVAGVTKGVQHIMQDAEGILWLATSGTGLIKLDPDNLQLTEYPFTGNQDGPSHPYLFYLFEDSRRNFWVGTAASGLNLFDRQNESFLVMDHDPDENYSLSANGVLCLAEDRAGYLWVGTGAGLNRLSMPLLPQMHEKVASGKLSITFGRFGRKQGLPNEVIYGIEQDSAGLFYISTNEGLVQFKPFPDPQVLRIFSRRDGLQDNEFNMTATAKAASGALYFGGIGGLSTIRPHRLNQVGTAPEVQIHGMQLYNLPVHTGQVKTGTRSMQKHNNSYVLSESILSSSTIKLRHHHKVISLEFSVLHFLDPERNVCRYQLEGFDQEWIKADQVRSVTYTNLAPGRYTFKVQASSSEGVWNEEGDALMLLIPPPPWLSWYAWVFYVVCVAAALYLTLKMRIRKATQALERKAEIATLREQDRAAFRKESAANFHDEAGNKLTRIQLYTSLIKNSLHDPDTLDHYREQIERNTRELSTGMRDFLWVLDPEKGSLFETVLKMKAFAEEQFREQGISISVEGLSESLHGIALNMKARKAILQLFREAVQNSVKYAETTAAGFEVTLQNTELTLTFFDRGKGFDPSTTTSDGYGRKSMQLRADQIDGSLRLESFRNIGTRVTLRVDITHLRDE